MQTDLWGNPIVRSEKFYVFHDESESMPDKRWLLVGLLFVPVGRADKVRKALQHCRSNESYNGEIHFAELPGSFRGEYGAKARVARKWLQAYQDYLHEDARFCCLAVDRHSPAYEHKRFTKSFHAYNRFTAMALKAGIVWHLQPELLDELHLCFVSDAKNRMTRLDRGMVDNFDVYIPYRAALDAFLAQREGRKYPTVVMELVLEDSANEDLLQLTDLLLGATQMAIVAGSSRKTKRELGLMVARWCQDLRKPPWQQRLGMHRKFNLWGFPDDNGRPYNDVPMNLMSVRRGSRSLRT